MLLVFVVVLAAATIGAAQNEDYQSISTAIVVQLQYVFGTNFSASCVSQGCPALRNSQLCPSNSNTEVDQKVLSLVAKCFTREMCGVVMDPRSILPLNFSTDQVLPGLTNVIKGHCTIVSSATTVENLSQQSISVATNPSNSEYPLLITTVISNVTVPGAFACAFELFLNPDNSSASTTINLPLVSLLFQFNYTSQILASATDFSKNFQVYYSNIGIDGLNIFLPNFFPDLNVGQFFSSNFQSYAQLSGLNQAMTNTLASIYQAAFQATSNNC